MYAFHNDPAIKAFYLARVQAHRRADEIRHGYYWEQSKGCAVGCTLHSSDHAAYETKLGIPRVLARLEDGIFEALASPDDLAWPEQFLEAIPVGADLALVWPQFFLRLATDPAYGLLQHVQARKYARRKQAMQKVIDYYGQWVKEEKKPDAAYAAAYATATAYAAAYATYATATAYASSTAYASATAADAADAAAAAAADADYAANANYAANAADAAAASDAADAGKRGEARRWQSLVLLELLEAAPLATG